MDWACKGSWWPDPPMGMAHGGEHSPHTRGPVEINVYHLEVAGGRFQADRLSGIFGV